MEQLMVYTADELVARWRAKAARSRALADEVMARSSTMAILYDSEAGTLEGCAAELEAILNVAREAS